MGHRMLTTESFLERPSLPWQRNLEHNGLELGLRKKYIEDLCVRWGVFEVGLFWHEQCAIIRKRINAPSKNHTLNVRKIVITYQP